MIFLFININSIHIILLTLNLFIMTFTEYNTDTEIIISLENIFLTADILPWNSSSGTENTLYIYYLFLFILYISKNELSECHIFPSFL